MRSSGLCRPQSMKTPAALNAERLRSANRPSSCGCVHRAAMPGMACGLPFGTPDDPRSTIRGTPPMTAQRAFRSRAIARKDVR
jgi:hypothetical protein